MKTNILTKKIHRGVFLACLLAGIVFIILLACEEADISTTEDKLLPLSYAEVTHGTVAIKNPIITGVTITGYTLEATGTGTGTVVPPTIEPTTGAITVKTTTTAGTYKITATTTDGATSTKSLETMFYITTTPADDLTELNTAIKTGVDNFGNTADFNYIKTENITNMTGVFCSEYENDGTKQQQRQSVRPYLTQFNGDISKWDVSKVTDMTAVFHSALAFNGDISLWKVNNVENMGSMFSGTKKFNKDISNWDVSSVTNMKFMFQYAEAFKQNLKTWEDKFNTTANNGAGVTKYNMFKGSGLETEGNLPSWYTVAAVTKVTIDLDNTNIDVTGDTTTATMTAKVTAVGEAQESVTFVETDKDGNGISTPHKVVIFASHSTRANTIVLTAKAPGEAWIVATSTEDPTKKSDPTKITVNGVVSVSIVGRNFYFGINGQKTLSTQEDAYGTAKDKGVTWASDDEEVATVDTSTGEVTAVKLGTAKITATSSADDTKKATVKVTITVPVPLISLNDYSEVAQGTDAVINVIFDGNITIDMGITYALTTTTETSNFVLPLLDDATGTITVNPSTTAGSYKITATASGIFNTGTTLYKGSSEAIFYVTTSPTNITDLETAVKKGINNFGNTADFNYIKTENMTTMEGVFSKDYKNGNGISKAKTFVENFNGDISLWNVEKVKNMSAMFQGATAFTSDLKDWDVRNVTDMSYMFKGATVFTSDLKNWKVDNVKYTYSMFENAIAFTSNLSAWNVSNVQYMYSMFKGATAFTSDLKNWNVSRVKEMDNMFDGSGLANNRPSWYK